MKQKNHNHSTSNKSIIDGDTYSYVNTEEILLSCFKIVNIKTGQEVELNHSDKNLYVFMRKRYVFFMEKENQRDEKYKKGDTFYYPDQKDLAEDLGVGLSTVKRGLKKLSEVGLIETGKSGKSNFYKVNMINPETFTFYRKYKGELVSFDKWKDLISDKQESKLSDKPELKKTSTIENLTSEICVEDIDDPFPILEKPKVSASSTEYPDYYQFSERDYDNQDDNIDDFLESCGQYQSQLPDRRKIESSVSENEDYDLPF